MRKVFINAIKRDAEVKVIGCNVVEKDIMPVYAVRVDSNIAFLLTRYKNEILYKFISSYEFHLLDSFNWDMIQSGKQMYLGFRAPITERTSVQEVEHYTVYKAHFKGFLVNPDDEELYKKLIEIEHD